MQKSGTLGLGMSVGMVLRQLAEVQEQIDQMRRVSVQGGSRARLAREAAKIIRCGGTLSQAQLAAHLGVSTKKIQRMEVQGQVRRCPALSGVVRYAAGDALRLASGRKEV